MCLDRMIIHTTAFFPSVLFVFTTENKVFFPHRQADTVCISPSILFACFAEHKEMFLNLTKCIFRCRCVCLADPWANTHKSWAQPLPNSPIQGKLPLKLTGTQHPIIISLDWTSCEPTQRNWGVKLFPCLFLEEKWEVPWTSARAGPSVHLPRGDKGGSYSLFSSQNSFSLGTVRTDPLSTPLISF